MKNTREREAEVETKPLEAVTEMVSLDDNNYNATIIIPPEVRNIQSLADVETVEDGSVVAVPHLDIRRKVVKEETHISPLNPVIIVNPCTNDDSDSE